MRKGESDVGCETCPLGEAQARREFLRDALTRTIVALGALAALPVDTWAALPISFTSGSGHRAEKVYPLPASDGVAIDKDESVIIARFQNRAYAFSLACPHQNTALRWEARNQRFQCPKHKLRYRPNGSFIEGRATRGMDRFAVQRDGDQLLVNSTRCIARISIPWNGPLRSCRFRPPRNSTTIHRCCSASARVAGTS